ncbi:MAG: T9SS type A sorting domain-containing protein, partial [Chitinophagales bacterium]
VYTVNPVYKKEAPGIYTITPSALVLKVPNNYTINYLPGNLYVNEEEGNAITVSLTCVQVLTNDPSGFAYAAYFAFNNPNSASVFISIGSNNSITTSGSYSGQQPTIFPPGNGKFKIYFNGSQLTWKLVSYGGTKSISASSSSTKCTTNQIYQVGEQAISGEVTAESPDLQSADPQSAIYPNPARNQVNVYIKDEILSGNEVEMIDVTGRSFKLTATIISDHRLQVDLNKLSSGIYAIRIKTTTGFRIFRVVKD